jgi:hypothetical protein
MDQFLVRSDNQQKRVLYFVSRGVKQMLQDNTDRFKVVNAGIRAFGRSELARSLQTVTGTLDEGALLYRFHQEIVNLIHPHLDDKCFIDIPQEDLIEALKHEFPLIQNLSESVRDQLNALSPGGYLLRFRPSVDDAEDVLHYSVWRARSSINVLLAKKERLSILMRLVGFEKAQEIVASGKMGKTQEVEADVTEEKQETNE